MFVASARGPANAQDALVPESFILRCAAVNGTTVCVTRGNPNGKEHRRFNASLGTAYGAYGNQPVRARTPGAADARQPAFASVCACRITDTRVRD